VRLTFLFLPALAATRVPSDRHAGVVSSHPGHARRPLLAHPGVRCHARSALVPTIRKPSAPARKRLNALKLAYE